MHKQIGCLLPLLALGAWGPAKATPTQCFLMETVTWVGQGYVDHAYGPDVGNAIYFTIGNGKVYPIRRNFNFNDPPGNGHHRTLLLAMAAGYKLTGYDNDSTT